jgi:GNAT superfamily N-acetyltransferase
MRTEKCQGRLTSILLFCIAIDIFHNLVVSETLRSGGIGAKLIEACKEYGRQNGADFMRTQVFPQNVRGMQFYERQGFSEKMKTIETYL